MKNALLKTLMILLLSAVGAGAQGLSFEDAWSLAKTHSPKVRVLQAKVDAASIGRLKAWSAQLPHLSLDGHHLLNAKFQEMVIDLGGGPSNFALPETYSDYALNASWTVFDGFKTWNSVQAAGLEYSASQLEQKRALFELKSQVRLKFNEALAANLLTEVARQNVETLQRHLNDVRARLRSGAATRFDSLRVEVQLEDAKTDLLQAQDKVTIAEAQLAEALGLKQLSDHPQGQLPTFSSADIESVQASIDDRDDRKAALLHEQSAHKLAQATRLSWVPQVSIFAQQDWYNYANYDWSDHLRRAYTYGVTFKWNLFDGGERYATLRQDLAQQRILAAKTDALTLAIPTEVLTWKRRFVQSIAIYKAATANVVKAKESVRLARSGVTAGVQTQTDLLDAERDLNMANAKVVNAQVASVEALNHLELALGRPLAR